MAELTIESQDAVTQGPVKQGDVKGDHGLLCQNLLPKDGEIIRSPCDGKGPSLP